MTTKELYKLDAQNIQQGWQLIILKSQVKIHGCQYGFCLLKENLSSLELLVFGGIQDGHPYAVLDTTAILKIDMVNMEKSELKLLVKESKTKLPSEERLLDADRFYFNEYFPVWND